MTITLGQDNPRGYEQDYNKGKDSPIGQEQEVNSKG